VSVGGAWAHAAGRACWVASRLGARLDILQSVVQFIKTISPTHERTGVASLSERNCKDSIHRGGEVGWVRGRAVNGARGGDPSLI